MEGRCKKTQLKHLFHPCQFRFVSNSEYSCTLSKNSFNQEGTGKIQRCCNKAGALRPPWWPYRGQNIQESSLQASQHFHGTQTHYLALKKKKKKSGGWCHKLWSAGYFSKLCFYLGRQLNFDKLLQVAPTKLSKKPSNSVKNLWLKSDFQVCIIFGSMYPLCFERLIFIWKSEAQQFFHVSHAYVV